MHPITREDASARVSDILRVLNNQDGLHPQGPDRVGATGYRGFFYHFLGIDGLRKQNFDFEATAIDESLNTVEVSVIDTALALAGVVTAGRYFDRATPEEELIRTMADEIYAAVDWRFMLYTNPSDPNDPQNNQFYLGWKPNEMRDDESGQFGRFKIDDPEGLGQYASRSDGGAERPATLDFYTDEAILVALLAMGSGQVGREVWDSIMREDDDGTFVKTFPGSLFTYQFASAWLDTAKLGTDNHPTRPINFFENTRSAIVATRDYAIENGLSGHSRATWEDGRGALLWGISATEGPFDQYFAEAAPPAALAESGRLIDLEAEDGVGNGSIMQRDAASGERTILLLAGESRTSSFHLEGKGRYEVLVTYSNDNFGPLESISISIDGQPIGSFTAQDTGDFGFGWNIFVQSESLETGLLSPGSHNLTALVSGGDGGGVEIDVVELRPVAATRPLELGTVTNYGVGSSIVHTSNDAVAGLWASARFDLNQDGRPDLLHPRFGYADSFNLDISDALLTGVMDPVQLGLLRVSGPWQNPIGFAIDHGPLLIMIDNYLEEHFVPGLFMSHPDIEEALAQLFVEARFGLFTNRDNRYDVDADRDVDVFDLIALIGEIRTNGFHDLPGPPGPTAPPPFLDVDGNNRIDFLDLREVLFSIRSGRVAQGEPRVETSTRSSLENSQVQELKTDVGALGAVRTSLDLRGVQRYRIDSTYVRSGDLSSPRLIPGPKRPTELQSTHKVIDVLFGQPMNWGERESRQSIPNTGQALSLLRYDLIVDHVLIKLFDEIG
jgi:hypothetical protein